MVGCVDLSEALELVAFSVQVIVSFFFCQPVFYFVHLSLCFVVS